MYQIGKAFSCVWHWLQEVSEDALVFTIYELSCQDPLGNAVTVIDAVFLGMYYQCVLGSLSV